MEGIANHELLIHHIWHIVLINCRFTNAHLAYCQYTWIQILLSIHFDSIPLPQASDLKIIAHKHDNNAFSQKKKNLQIYKGHTPGHTNPSRNHIKKLLHKVPLLLLEHKGKGPANAI
ncbi:hypothetical protein U1Q18_052571 [Sarracenia purpurea var. burkii]